jgi:hypothetical protein
MMNLGKITLFLQHGSKLYLDSILPHSLRNRPL